MFVLSNGEIDLSINPTFIMVIRYMFLTEF